MRKLMQSSAPSPTDPDSRHGIPSRPDSHRTGRRTPARPRMLPSLRRELFFLLFTLTFAVSGAVCMTAYFIFRQTIVEEIGRARVDVLKQVGERTRLVKNSLATVSNLYYRDPDIQRALVAPARGNEEIRILSKSIDDKADRYRLALDELGLDFYLVVSGERGFLHSSRRKETYDFSSAINSLWFKDVVAARGDIYWVSSYEDFKSTESPQYVFSAARALFEPSTGDYLGLLLVSIRERLLHEAYRSLLTGRNTIYLADERGSIVSHPDESMLGLNYVGVGKLRALFGGRNHTILLKAGRGILFSHFRDPESGWHLFEEIPLDEIFGPLKRISFALALIFTACMLISLGLAMFFSRRITQPLGAFVDSIERVRDGNLDSYADMGGWRELAEIGGAFNMMTGRLKELVAGIKDKEREKRKIELEFLRSQINPHFLHNTLFSVKCLVSMGKTSEAESMLTSFTELVRMTFRAKQEFVHFEEEVELVKKYADIQMIRYPGVFEIMYDIETRALRCLVPRLILQPVVENAIFHGPAPGAGKLLIRIEGRCTGDDLSVSILDNGKGMDREKLQKIQNGEDSGENGKESIALSNLKKRMYLHFGEGYGMEMHSTPGSGTHVRLHFPALE